MQIDPIRPKLKLPGTKHLKLEYDGLLSSFAFNFMLRRYTVGTSADRVALLLSTGDAERAMGQAAAAKAANAKQKKVGTIGRFRYIASRAERRRLARNSVWAFDLGTWRPLSRAER